MGMFAYFPSDWPLPPSDGTCSLNIHTSMTTFLIPEFFSPWETTMDLIPSFLGGAIYEGNHTPKRPTKKIHNFFFYRRVPPPCFFCCSLPSLLLSFFPLVVPLPCTSSPFPSALFPSSPISWYILVFYPPHPNSNQVNCTFISPLPPDPWWDGLTPPRWVTSVSIQLLFALCHNEPPDILNFLLLCISTFTGLTCFFWVISKTLLEEKNK